MLPAHGAAGTDSSPRTGIHLLSAAPAAAPKKEDKKPEAKKPEPKKPEPEPEPEEDFGMDLFG